MAKSSAKLICGIASKDALDSLTTQAIRDLSGRLGNRLFLSATPHNGQSNSFSALLEMLARSGEAIMTIAE